MAIINGQDVIPVNTAWSIPLIEFIRAVNRYDGRAVTDRDVHDYSTDLKLNQLEAS